MENYLPYVVSLLMALISGVTSYAVTRKKTKADIERIEKQHELDLANQRELFEMEKEKMELAHRHEMEKQEKEFENSLGADMATNLFGEVMKMPEVREELSRSIRQGTRKKKK